jgi:hypothetical protein
MKNYKTIIEHYEACFKAHGDTHLGMDWPTIEDALKRYQVMLELFKYKKQDAPMSLLDFGCGASHLFQFMQEQTTLNINYSGLDISQAFIDLSQEKFPDNTYYCLDVLEESEKLPHFDYIICNGIFTEKRELSFEEMWLYTQQMLLVIFSKAEKGMAFNVMSKAVDWERWDLFHLPTDLLIDFMTKELSRHFIIRNDYGLYEYTVYLYK